MIWLLAVIGLVIAWMIYGLNNRVWVFFQRYIFRRPMIVIERDDGETWFAPLMRRPVSGRLMAYRYPKYQIGVVTLEDDGTGYYYGSVLWRRV